MSQALPKRDVRYGREEVRGAIAEVMPAFELIEDRKAHYKSTRALSLIADNAWNGGIVLGKGVAVPLDRELDGLDGRLTINGSPAAGKTDDPMGALAWIANLAADRGRPLEQGQVVITGSLIPTVPIAGGDHFRFEIAGLGAVEMTAVG
jgi:2-oxo-3-hexenedioate decarboxylase/2-keto-4-pentenoate hydratase